MSSRCTNELNNMLRYAYLRMQGMLCVGEGYSTACFRPVRLQTVTALADAHDAVT